MYRINYNRVTTDVWRLEAQVGMPHTNVRAPSFRWSSGSLLAGKGMQIDRLGSYIVCVTPTILWLNRNRPTAALSTVKSPV